MKVFTESLEFEHYRWWAAFHNVKTSRDKVIEIEQNVFLSVQAERLNFPNA